jgi:hypothetical protein
MEKARIVVMVEGGVVHDILSNVPADVLIFDADVEGVDEERIVKITLLDDAGNLSGMVEEVYVSTWDVPGEPSIVKHYLKQVEEPNNG